MKRRRLKFKDFHVFIFNMDRGERKALKPEEVNRGLTDFGPHTLYPISVFTKGHFVSIRPGREPWHSGAGDGGQYYVDCDSLVGHALVATEDDSEYHCIVPIGEPKFWDRSVYSFSRGAWTVLYPGQYCYVASGKLEGFEEKMIHNTSDTPWNLKSDDPAIVVIMWCNNESEVPA